MRYCPVKGCTKPLHYGGALCEAHWLKAPKSLRDLFAAAYVKRENRTPDDVFAMGKALQLIVDYLEDCESPPKLWQCEHGHWYAESTEAIQAAGFELIARDHFPNADRWHCRRRDANGAQLLLIHVARR